MANAHGDARFGPIWLMPGVTNTHVVTKLYGTFVGVAMLSGMHILQGYVLTEHLQIPHGQQGTISGNLTFWTEIVAIFMFTPFGALSDRIGRRPVYIIGILMAGLGYGLYPLATSIGELTAYRMIFAIGLAGTASMMASLTNDYPQERSRGMLIGIASMMNILGTIFVAGVLAQIPALVMDAGGSAIDGGKAMLWSATALCVVTAIISQFGLKGGTVVAKHEQASSLQLLTVGLKSIRNPRISLSYAGAFAARSDLVIKGMFLALWAIHDGALRDMSPAEAMARFGIVILIMQGVSFFVAPFFGWFMDNVNRVTAMATALAFATIGYLSMGIITSPLDFAMIPFFILISLGSSFMIKASIALVGQEAPPKERGAIIATNGMFGALGILVLALVGGRLFDAWGPWAPFVIAGAYQSVLFVAAILVRIYAPGPQLIEKRGNWMMAFYESWKKPEKATAKPAKTPAE